MIEYRKRLVRTAYPRNGNVHNPTRYYLWDVYRDGKAIDGGFRTLRGARAEYPGGRVSREESPA
jgi:hypothetical protein